MSRVTTVLGLAVLVLLVIWAGQRWVIYFPEGAPPAPAAVGLPTAEPIDFTTRDGLRLEGWYVPGVPPLTGHTVLVFNGNAGNRAYRATLATALARRGLACVLFDYRGYGGNPGLPSERGLTEDALAARRAVAARPDVDPQRIVYFGESLGAAVPFSNLADIGAHHYPFLPVRWLLRDHYPVAALVRDLRLPLLIIAGDDDHIVPPHFSQDVFDAAPGPKRLVMIPEADHNDEALAEGPAVIDAIEELLAPEPRGS
jgi:hypothetical protein